MTQNKSFAELAMDSTRIPSDASAVTTTLSKSLKDGEVLTDDGNSYSSVQTAQDNASSWIKLPPNAFTESVTIDTAGLAIVGSGFDSDIDGTGIGTALTTSASDVTVKNITATRNTSDSSVMVLVTGDGCSFTGCQFVGARLNVKSSNTTVSQCTFNDAEAYGSDDTSTGIIISSNNIDRANNNTFCIGSNNGLNDSVISNNILRRAAFDNINLDNGNDDCIITGIRSLGAGRDGIAIVQGTDNLVADCRVSGSATTDFNDTGTSTLVATDDSANSTIITDDTSGQQSS